MTIIKPVASPCNNILILAANPSLMTNHYAHNSSETCPTLLQSHTYNAKKTPNQTLFNDTYTFESSN